MLDTRWTGSTWTSIFFVTCFLAPATFTGAQTEVKSHTLTNFDESYVDATGTLTRCGKFFVLETKKFGELEVKQLHVSYEIADGGVALSSKDIRDLEVVVDDSKATPTLTLKRENPGIEKDRLELSDASYEEAKECIPPPKSDQATEN